MELKKLYYGDVFEYNNNIYQVQDWCGTNYIDINTGLETKINDDEKVNKINIKIDYEIEQEVFFKFCFDGDYILYNNNIYIMGYGRYAWGVSCEYGDYIALEKYDTVKLLKNIKITKIK